jgi:hypothetical protein
MKGSKKKALSLDEKLANAERILKGKELNPNGRELFEKVLKKAATPKPHGSK